MPTTEKHTDRVQQIFDGARVKPPEERDAFVASACGDDAALRAEVESLLGHHDRAGDSFLRPAEPDPALRPPPDRPDPRIGKTIAGCRIKSVIDSGGMGTVYLAEQENPRRDVALKIMHQYVASRSALRRFQFESQVLAKLQHPNIAQVFLAGMSEDDHERVPYFVMEHIPGAKTLLDHAEEQNLGVRERLAMFARVCDAVSHGHQKGVIHRDLKPANILVDSGGEPKVIDFGVARSTDADVAVTTQMTEVGQLIGTLQYMSPEQCDGKPDEIDTRSDVYSLGVVLFELLTGRLPYDVSHMTIQSAARSICEQPPAAPSTFDRRLRGDLDTIVLKALDKNRDKRYPSAESLAADIRRFLTGEPISARPPTRWTRTVRWVTRHPILTSAIGSIATAALILGATLSTVWFINSRPYEIARYRGGQFVAANDSEAADEVRLLSRTDRILHSWGEEPSAICDAELVDRPSASGGGKLAIIAYSRATTDARRGSLCAYDIDGDWRKPIWTRRIANEDILPLFRRNRGFTAHHFSIQQCETIDVFANPENPVDEIVAVFANIYSQRVIRIYDVDGELLYQVWYDGEASKFRWLRESHLLVFAGTNARASWDQFGYPRSDKPDPIVVFALRPEIGYIGKELMSYIPGKGPGDPVWHKWLCDGNGSVGRGTFVCNIREALTSAPGSSAHFVFHAVSDRREIVGWDIDASGTEIENTRVVGETYKWNQQLPLDDPARLPDPYSFELRDEPPNWVKEAMAQEAAAAASQLVPTSRPAAP